jgi:hypothetical protein
MCRWLGTKLFADALNQSTPSTFVGLVDYIVCETTNLCRAEGKHACQLRVSREHLVCLGRRTWVLQFAVLDSIGKVDYLDIRICPTLPEAIFELQEPLLTKASRFERHAKTTAETPTTVEPPAVMIAAMTADSTVSAYLGDAD